MKQTVRLTESEFRAMVQETINEALQDEGLWGGISALGSKFGNKASRVAQNTGNAIGNAWDKTKERVGNAYNNAVDNVKQGYQNAKQTVGNAYNKAADNVKQGYESAKKTYQAGSANQDAQKAIQNAVRALNDLMAADQKLQQNGMNSIIGNKAQKQAIDACLKALQGGGATSISNRFQHNRNAYTR